MRKKVVSAGTSENELSVQLQQGESEEQATARVMLSPALQSARTLQEYINTSDGLGLQALIDTLEKQTKKTREDNLERIEEMLLSQAHTLDAIANNLFRRAKNQEYMSNLESYLKLGLRAQSQCRTTLEALLRVKTPKTRLNQTNIAHNQQVNNRLCVQNEVLEKTDGERLDTGTPAEAVRADSDMEAVDA